MPLQLVGAMSQQVHRIERLRLRQQRVEGVRSVEIDFEAKTATVTFDPSIASVEAIAAASTNAGYPAAPQS